MLARRGRWPTGPGRANRARVKRRASWRPGDARAHRRARASWPRTSCTPYRPSVSAACSGATDSFAHSQAQLSTGRSGTLMRTPLSVLANGRRPAPGPPGRHRPGASGRASCRARRPGRRGAAPLGRWARHRGPRQGGRRGAERGGRPALQRGAVNILSTLRALLLLGLDEVCVLSSGASGSRAIDRPGHHDRNVNGPPAHRNARIRD